MNTLKCLFSVLIIIFIFAGCSDHKDTVLPARVDEIPKSKEVTEAVNKLTDEEKDLLIDYLMRIDRDAALDGKGIPEGTTIGAAIEIQKQWAAESQKKAEQLKQIQRGTLKEMNKMLTVSLLTFKFYQADPVNNIPARFFVRIAFENNSDKNIAGSRGVVVFRDVFGDIIKRVNLSNTQRIKSNGKNVWFGTMDYNKSLAEDNKLKNTEFSKIQFEWEPVVYLFEDGTKVEMPLT